MFYIYAITMQGKKLFMRSGTNFPLYSMCPMRTTSRLGDDSPHNPFGYEWVVLLIQPIPFINLKKLENGIEIHLLAQKLLACSVQFAKTLLKQACHWKQQHSS